MQAAMASVADMARSLIAPPADSRRHIVARCSSKTKEAASPGICETHTLPLALSIEDATAALKSFLLEFHAPASACGILRFQVPLPPSVKALHWLQSQPECPLLSPRIYFSPRNATSLTLEEDDDEHNSDVSATTVAGAGSAVTFQGTEPFSMEHCKSIKRFLSEDSPFIRAYGAMRFDPHSQPSPEWEGFGAFYFFIPRVELCEARTYSLLAVNLTWGDVPLDKAIETLLKTLTRMEVHIISSFEPIHVNSVMKSHSPDEPSWCANVRRTLENIPDRITKAVMARQTKLEVEGDVSLYTLLASLQEQSPLAYQFCLQLPDGTSFLGNTPEQLFAKNGLLVTSEAVAATRPRGATSVDDDLIALEMLQSCKDHTEFQIVEDGVKGAMESICKHVKMVMTKEILKQPTVQHLHTRLVGELADNYEEYNILRALHPTPAVCGNPRVNARATIGCTEAFDRGLYAGPFGWFGGQGAEFAVGIRSALIRSCRQDTKDLNGFPSAQGKLTKRVQEIYLYAGAGIVEGSDASCEWQELETKTSQFEALLKPVKQLKDAANINMLWASLIVEECCRLGVTHFCVAPGSRSSPLAEAAAANPRVSCISCLDERALAFYALGYGRGARKAAAVVTTSGTAVSNLLPAVVEASQDCVPLLVLSADLPHELRDTGWNQTINQVEHFGSFVRYHFDLPPATDEINVRMVLTTLDTAVFRATTDPCGPVHINCPYRQPLEASPKQWDLNCLEGLTRWMTNSHPFTTYVSSGSSLSDTRVLGDIRAVRDTIVGAKRGLIVVGGLHESQTVWAVYKLAKYLRWPLVPDILSGLKLASMTDINIIHHLDHILLSPRLSSSVAPDVILQIGSRITSKRLSMFMQNCNPDAHILIEQHPYRHDPAHRLTHRIRSSISGFTHFLLQELKSELSETSYSVWLRELSETVGREITFQLRAEDDLTEPGIAQIVSANINRGSALFLGNSMPIRDMDMYADVQERFFNQQEIPSSSITVAANRGVNGIDGVLSSATGFAAGSKKRVTLLIGDISFLHDTNGLMLLNGRGAQPPVTVVVVNNRGGGIFSLLPLATFVHSTSTFRTLISTEHNVQLGKLCQAHSLTHMYVQSKDELLKALRIAHSSSSSCVIEVESNIQENAHFHRNMQKEICEHLHQAFPILLRQLWQSKNTIIDFELHFYRFPLRSPITTSVTEPLCRKGFLIQITLSNGATGVGEVAPLPGLHEEDLLDVEEQLRLLQRKLRGAELPENLALLNGAFSDWFLTYLGEQVHTIFPSVRCGLEMAALEALAASNKCSLWELLTGKQHTGECSLSQEYRPGSLSICGLIDSQETPDEVAAAAVQLVREGFMTLKIKVARRVSPLDDAAVIAAVRRETGRDIRLRVDANRGWTLLQAIQFAEAVKDYDLEYLEEPVNDLSSLPTFLERSSVRVALDESIDENILQIPTQTHDNIVAAVIKPCRVGGFENANFLARLARKRKMIPVISACFESSISLSAYAQFAAIVDQRGDEDSLAHGLGTYTWTINEDGIVKNSFSTFVNGTTVSIAKAATACPVLDSPNVIVSAKPRVRGFTEIVTTGTYQFSFHILEVTIEKAKHDKPTTLVFLHGFLGSAEEWLPIMSALSGSFRCLAVDLPGHGKTSVSYAHQWGTEVLAEALSELLIRICNDNKVVVIGYSMGARIALAMSVRNHKQIEAAVIISGSPGLRDEALKQKRAAQDEELAERLRMGGLESFITSWYRKSMWKSLSHIPEFQTLKKAKVTMNAERVDDLATALSRLSIGRQPCLWQLLGATDAPPLLLVAGQLDKKFSRIAQEMAQANPKFKLVLVEKTGHNVHVESPLRLIRILRRFVCETVRS